MLYTLGELAKHFGVETWQVQRLADRGQIPFTKVGNLRTVKRSDLRVVELKLIDAGYLKPEQPEQGE